MAVGFTPASSVVMGGLVPKGPKEPGGKQIGGEEVVELNFNCSLEPVWLWDCQPGHFLVNPNCHY